MPPSQPASHILLVEDNPELRQTLVLLFEDLGYTIAAAANGQEALSYLQRAPSPRLILLDLIMPGINGTELASELRKRQPDLKVLFISGYTDDEKLLSGSLDPNAQFLAKPFLPGELVRAVHGMLAMNEAPKSSRK